MNAKWRAHACVLGANILYGVNYSFGKTALQSLHPFTIVSIRVVVAMLLFLAVHLIFIREKVKTKDHWRLIASAVFGVALNQLLFFEGLSLTSEMHASLIMITTPILVILLSWLWLHYRVGKKHIAGILSGAVGVTILILSGLTGKQTGGDPFGDICIMLNASSYALFLVMTKPLMKLYHPLTVTKWIFIYGCILVIPVGIPGIAGTNWSQIPGPVMLSLAFVVLGATFFAYMLNLLGLHFGNPALVSIYIYTQPVIAFIVALLNHTDHLSTEKMIAALLIFGGVALVSYSSNQEQKASTA